MYVTRLDASKAFDKLTTVNCSLNKLTGAVLLLLCAFSITSATPSNSLSDGIVAFLNVLTFQMVLNRVESFLPVFLTCTWMT